MDTYNKFTFNDYLRASLFCIDVAKPGNLKLSLIVAKIVLNFGWHGMDVHISSLKIKTKNKGFQRYV